MAAYYNEIDPYAAQWLRNLISAGHIAPGVVDERSIEDVHPDDLREFTQCHFFAGVGVWSYALRLSGWPDDRPVWTGSCPCQPFSTAGEGLGFSDPRHLWPDFAWLIRERRPPVVFGEQVASKAVGPWIDLVHANLEAMGYAFGAVPFPSAGVGAPHIRDRLFWLANANANGKPSRQGRSLNRWRNQGGDAEPWPGSSGGGMPYNLANSESIGRERQRRSATVKDPGRVAECSSHGRLADTDINRRDQTGQRIAQAGDDGSVGDVQFAARQSTAGPVNGLWADADWLFCRDGKWRPVRSGSFPLAYGAASRVGRLRAYGNAINAEAAKEFIAAHMEAMQ